MTLRVRDTYLSAAILGDVGMHLAKGLLKGDFGGAIIVEGSGNRGRDEDGDGVREPGRSCGNYTHSFTISEAPDPEAEVEAVRINEAGRTIYQVLDKAKAGKKIHATWPCVKHEPIDWENEYFELWRVRSISRRYWAAGKVVPPEVHETIAWMRKRIGRVYNWVQFLTFGLLRLANSWVCSGFTFKGFLAGSARVPGLAKIILSPDGRFDALPTPNDLVNSLKLIRVRYQGELEKEA